MSDPRAHPIVDAVLQDPVVKAVLQDPAATQAVDAAIAGESSVRPPDVPVSAPASAPAAPTSSTVMPGQAGAKLPDKPDVIVTATGKATAAPTTTEEEDRRTFGQRRVNLIWESQQALIATAVVATALYVSATLALLIIQSDATEQQMAIAVTAFVLLSNIVNLVIGFYFGRTNHQKVGGVEQGR